MSDDEPFVYQFPISDPAPPPAGVSQGWMVVWSGEPGPARVAKTAMIVDEDGTRHFVQTEDFTDCEVVDDTSRGHEPDDLPDV